MEKEKELLFEARKLTKLFGPTVALDEVDFKVYRGEITGLIGENGSGKSTITSIAAGMQPATSGEMFFEGKPHKPSTMLEGARAGIGMIVQEQGTVPGISIARNIFLGNESQFAKGPIISKAKMNAEAKKALDAIGFTGVDPSMPIESLSMQDRKLVEIAKVVYSRPEMLVVDETTTALSQQGREIIYGIMNRMKEENKAVVFISHDLDELMAKCDTLTVLRDGKLITTLSKDQMNEDVIKRNMVGREMTGAYYRSDYGVPVSSEVVLKAEGITTGTGTDLYPDVHRQRSMPHIVFPALPGAFQLHFSGAADPQHGRQYDGSKTERYQHEENGDRSISCKLPRRSGRGFHYSDPDQIRQRKYSRFGRHGCHGGTGARRHASFRRTEIQDQRRYHRCGNHHDPEQRTDDPRPHDRTDPDLPRHCLHRRGLCIQLQL
ncbi:MAG: ATP-binding cassette domain-containing protein [Lachnospiraceae bacterium]|jgi:ABC-type multidrug transport system ATPase subunit|nr:ATP-binding cassette domain-containing protein [Lachnospiraceae bacterium]